MSQVQTSSDAIGTSELMLADTSLPALASKVVSLQVMPKLEQAPMLQA